LDGMKSALDESITPVGRGIVNDYDLVPGLGGILVDYGLEASDYHICTIIVQDYKRKHGGFAASSSPVCNHRSDTADIQKGVVMASLLRG
jgi:hypothetical protein